MTEGDVKYLVIDAEKIHKEKMLVLEELDSQTANRKANLLLSIQIKRNSIQILEESLNKMGQDWRGSEDAYKKKAALVEEVKVLDKEFFSYKGNETIYSIHLSMALDGKYERGKVLDAIPEGAKILI